MKKISTLILGLGLASSAAFADGCLVASTGVAVSLPPALCNIPAPVIPAGALSAKGAYLVAPPNTIGANFQEYAFTGDTSNPFGAGDETFVLNVQANKGAILGVTVNSVAGFSIAVGYTAASNQAPASASITAGVLQFNFAGTSPFEAGQADEFIIYTNAPASDFAGTGGILDGSGGTGSPFLEPSGVVATPEPISMSLVGGGLALLGMLRFRRKA